MVSHILTSLPIPPTLERSGAQAVRLQQWLLETCKVVSAFALEKDSLGDLVTHRAVFRHLQELANDPLL